MNNSDDLDPRLQQLYRQLVKEQPSPELDAKILAAAQQAIKKPSRWFMPFSMAASVVMVGSLVLYWTKQPETLQQNLSVSSAQEKIVAESKAATPALTNDTFSGVGGSSSPSLQTEIAKPSAAMATDEQMPEKLKDLRSEPYQNRVVNQTKEIKEEVANISSTPESALLKQDAPEHELRDDRLSLEEVNQPVVADSAMPEQRALAAAPPMSVGAIAPLAKRQAAEKKAIAEKNKVAVIKPVLSLIEDVSFGMNQEQLSAIGFTCQPNVCSKILSPPQQVSYWGIPASQATLKALLQSNKVSQLVFLPQVDINTVVKAIEPLGVATDNVCDEQKSTIIKRVVEGYLLQVYLQEKSVNVVICAEK